MSIILKDIQFSLFCAQIFCHFSMLSRVRTSGLFAKSVRPSTLGGWADLGGACERKSGPVFPLNFLSSQLSGVLSSNSDPTRERAFFRHQGRVLSSLDVIKGHARAFKGFDEGTPRGEF